MCIGSRALSNLGAQRRPLLPPTCRAKLSECALSLSLPIYTRRCIYIYVHIYIYIYIHTYTHTHTHTHIYIYIYVYVYINIYIYMYMYICIYIYTYMHRIRGFVGGGGTLLLNADHFCHPRVALSCQSAKLSRR